MSTTSLPQLPTDSGPLWADSPIQQLPPLSWDFGVLDAEVFDPTSFQDLLNSILASPPQDEAQRSSPSTEPAPASVTPTSPAPPASPWPCTIQDHHTSRCDEGFRDPFTLARHIVSQHMRRDRALPLNASPAVIDRWLATRGVTDRSVRGSAKRRFIKLQLWKCDVCGESFGRDEALREHNTTYAEGRCAKRKRRARRRRGAAADTPSDSQSSVSSSGSPVPALPNVVGTTNNGAVLASHSPMPFSMGLAYQGAQTAAPYFPPEAGRVHIGGREYLLVPAGPPSQMPPPPLPAPYGGITPEQWWTTNTFGPSAIASPPFARDFGVASEHGREADLFAFLSSPSSSASGV